MLFPGKAETIRRQDAAQRDLYAVLGVAEDASLDRLTEAFIEGAKPLLGKDGESFTRLAHAYDRLSDPGKSGTDARYRSLPEYLTMFGPLIAGRARAAHVGWSILTPAYDKDGRPVRDASGRLAFRYWQHGTRRVILPMTGADAEEDRLGLDRRQLMPRRG